MTAVETSHALARFRPAWPGDPDVTALARAARGGDRDAFEALVRRYQRRTYGLAYQYLRDPVEAQDLAQEIFVRLFRNLGRFDPERPFEPWFWRLAANVAASYRRRRPVAPDRLTAVLPAADAADGLPLERALAGLGEGLRLPILMHYYLDLPVEEIAAAMGLSVSAVKSRMHRARATLRRALVEDG